MGLGLEPLVQWFPASEFCEIQSGIAAMFAARSGPVATMPGYFLFQSTIVHVA